MKRFLQNFLLSAACLFMAATASAYDFQAGDLYYNILDAGAQTCEVTKPGVNDASYSFASVTIPKTVTYNGKTYNVVGIGEAAFYGHTDSFTSVTFPDGLIYIGVKAFAFCRGLTDITIPNSVTSIGDEAFEGCAVLASVTIGESVATIGESAFADCDVLTSVAIPASVTYIGSGAFSGCSVLTEISVSPDNQAYRSVDGVLYTKDMTRLIQYPCGSTAINFEIPNTVTTISGYAFSGSILPSVVIPNSVTSLEDAAFCGCGLTSVALPESVTSIPSSCFFMSSSLTTINIPSTVTTIGSFAFFMCNSLTSVSVPKSVTSLGMCAFGTCPALNSVTLSDGLTYIGEYCFQNCTSLTSITIPNTVTSMANSIFFRCSSLASVTLPDGLTGIPYNCFIYCSALASIAIPESVTTIGSDAFRECTSLSEINTLNPTPPELEKFLRRFPFSDSAYATAMVNVPTGSLDAYRAADGWSLFANLQEKDFGGIGEVDADGEVSVTFGGGRIAVSGADGEAAEVYTVGGQLVYRGTASSIPVAGRGVYIVRVAGQTFKVAL